MLRQRVTLLLRNPQFEMIGPLHPAHRTDADDIDALGRWHECPDDEARTLGMNTEPFKRIVMPALLYSV